MKSKLPVVILIVLALALGVALFLQHQKSEQAKTAATLSLEQLRRELADEKKLAEAKVAKETEDAERAKTTLVTKSQELQTTTVELTETKATLEKTQTALKDTQGQLASAKEAVTARESRIKELTTEKDELEKHSTDLKSEISRRDGQITDTQRKLAASEGDREFLLKELKRLQNEKGDLERQFNDLLVLKEQMKKLKEEYALTKRLEWSRRGLADLNNRKGGEVLQRGFAVPKTVYTNNPDLNVEIRRDGPATITTPEKK